MSYKVEIATARAELIAAVPVTARVAEIARVWKPALDQVWAYLKANRGLTAGHNFFLYQHPARREDRMEIDFGVQVSGRFEQEGNVRCVATPAGDIARTVHVGPYDRMMAAHDALHAWCAENDRKIGKASWEIYGDWNSDPAKLKTTVNYLLR